jgi:hypothetical protein
LLQAAPRVGSRSLFTTACPCFTWSIVSLRVSRPALITPTAGAADRTSLRLGVERNTRPPMSAAVTRCSIRSHRRGRIRGAFGPGRDFDWSS